MSENVSPNSMSTSRRKLFQTKLVFGNNSLAIDSNKSTEKKPKKMNRKKVKRDTTETNSPIVAPPVCIIIDEEEPVAQVDSRLEGNPKQCDLMSDDDDIDDLRESTDSKSSIEIIEEIRCESKDNQQLSNEVLNDEYLVELKQDCQDNNPTLTALMTIGELKVECESLGLTLNADLHEDDHSDESSAQPSEGVIYEVESIYDTKMDKNLTYFWVKWKNYGESENTWEPFANLKDCRKLVDEYRHIKLLNDDNKMIVYRNWYKLKGIIEDIVEKKVAFHVMRAVLIIFNNVRLIDFHYTFTCVDQMRKALGETLKDIDSINKVKPVDRRINQMDNKFNDLIANLNILKRFRTIEEFFVYFDTRKTLERRLLGWQNRINDIIAEQKEGDPIAIENLVDCELPPADFEYIARCKTEDPTIVIDDDPPVYCECTDCESEHEECCVTVNGATIAYTKNGILKDSRRNRNAIYECNKKCKCSKDCINRVVQKGRKVYYFLF